jgi:phage tail tape-measure protein
MDDNEKESIGAMVGGGLGAATGARVGAVLIPVPLVGSFVGGVLGAAAGSAVGRRTGRALLDGAIAFVETVREDLDDLDLPGLLRGGPPALEAGGEPG